MVYLRQAVALDPNYALAYSTIAYNYGVVEDWYAPPREVMPQAEAAAKKAFELDPTLGDAGWPIPTISITTITSAPFHEFQHALNLIRTMLKFALCTAGASSICSAPMRQLRRIWMR
jgi:hypothetical protein